MSVSSARGTSVWAVALVAALAACTPGGEPVVPSAEPSESGESAPESVDPSIAREVPPEQRKPLARIPLDELCGLISAEELAQLGAAELEPGQPREIGFEPPARGCTYSAPTGAREVLVGAQRAGLGELGQTEVQLGPVRGTQTRHVNDCTVFADVEGATLQVTVREAEADSEQCDAAQAIAQYVLPAVRR